MVIIKKNIVSLKKRTRSPNKGTIFCFIHTDQQHYMYITPLDDTQLYNINEYMISETTSHT